MTSGPGNFALALLMLAAIALGAGGGWMIVRQGDRRKGTLMLLAAVVFLANVLIWTL